MKQLFLPIILTCVPIFYTAATPTDSQTALLTEQEMAAYKKLIHSHDEFRSTEHYICNTEIKPDGLHVYLIPQFTLTDKRFTKISKKFTDQCADLPSVQITSDAAKKHLEMYINAAIVRDDLIMSKKRNVFHCLMQ